MKKLARTQLISIRSIYLVISERGAITNDLSQALGPRKYEPRYQQEIHMYPFLRLNVVSEGKKQVPYQAGSYEFLLAL